MREIKFRAWDGHGMETKLWVPGYGTQSGATLELNNLNDYIGDRNVLMQYTGLKDKTGKEIYEGDILSIEKAYPTRGEVMFACGTFKVRWNSINYALEPIFQNFAEVEIIGNIYQNPELLDAKQ